jgi:VWFA-related protein
MAKFLCCLFIIVFSCFVAATAHDATSKGLQSSSPPADSKVSQVSKDDSVHGTASDGDSHVKIRVNLVVVPVVVRDSSGHAIGDLQKEDFRIFDNHKLQDISQFALEKSEITGTAATAVTGRHALFVAPTRFTVLLFDDVHLTSETLPQLRTAALHRFSSGLAPSERVAIFTTSGKLAQDFTDDRTKLADALNQLRLNPFPNSQIPDCLNMSHEEANRIVNRHDETTKETLVGRAMNACGIKTPLVAEKFVMEASERVLHVGNASTSQVFRALVAVLERLSTAPGQRSVVLVSPGFLVSDAEHHEYQVIDLAVRNRIVINALDARALAPETGDVEDSNPLGEFADGTGGTFYQNNNNLEEGIRHFSATPEFIYVLGFSPSDLRYDGAFHNIKVKLIGKHTLTANYRKGYFAPIKVDDPTKSENYVISNAVFSRTDVHELPIEMRIQFVRDDKPVAKLSVMALADLHVLPHRQSGGQNENELRIVAAVFDRDGKYMGSIDKKVDVFWRESEAGIRTAAKYDFILDSGNYLVRLVVHDSQSQQLFAQDSVIQIP